MKNSNNKLVFRTEFGTTIRRWRHKKRLSQEDFAEKADIHRTYVSSIELGKVEVGISIAHKLAKALDTQLSSLIRETEGNL